MAQFEPLPYQSYGYARRALERPDAVVDVLQGGRSDGVARVFAFCTRHELPGLGVPDHVNTVFNFNKRGKLAGEYGERLRSARRG